MKAEKLDFKEKVLDRALQANLASPNLQRKCLTSVPVPRLAWLMDEEHMAAVPRRLYWPARFTRHVMQLGEAEAGNVVRYGRGLAQKSTESGSVHKLEPCL
ncbi:uncharacterized [Tachysurus ichikawai]